MKRRSLMISFSLAFVSVVIVGILAFSNSAKAAVSFGVTPIYTNTFTSGSGTFQFATGNWGVSGGTLNESAAGNEHIALDGNTGWGYYSVSSDVTFVAGDDIALVFWGKDSNNFYMFRPSYGGQAAVFNRVNGVY